MDGYWASKEGEELGAALTARVEEWDRYLEASGELEMMRLAGFAYFGDDEDGFHTSRIGKMGTKGQLAVLKTNIQRSVIQNILTLTTTNLPGVLPVPKNTDRKAQAQALIAKGIVEHYRDDREVEEEIREAAEIGLVLTRGWLSVPWSEDAGDPVGEEHITDENGAIVDIREVHEGDSEVRVHLPTDIIFDIKKRSKSKPWLIVRTWQNRWDLIAKHAQRDEELTERIAMMPSKDPRSDLRDDLRRLTKRTADTGHNSDDIVVYEFYHDRTAALPKGKRCIMLAPDIVLNEDELRYSRIPVFEVQPARRFGSPFAYSSTIDTLGLQRAVDTLTSIPYSNQRATGVSTMTAQKGAGLDYKKVTEGLSVIYYDKPDGKPEMLAPPQTAPEVFAFRRDLMSDIANLQGLDALSMGREERDLSGAAMALLDSRTQRALSAFGADVIKLAKRVFNALVDNIRIFTPSGVTRKLPMLVGKARAPLLKDFTAQDLDGIDRISMETISPLMRQVSGRMEVANQLVAMKTQSGAPAINVEQYMALIETGKLEPLTEGSMAQLMNIRSENERLAQGQPAQAVWAENHVQHITEHMAVLASPEVREEVAQIDPMTGMPSPTVAGLVLEHIQEHVDLWRSADPAVLQVLGIPPPPPPMPMMPGPGMGDGTAPPAPGPQSATQPPIGAPPNVMASEAQPPDMPQMPTNPSTGQAYEPTEAQPVQSIAQ